MIVSNSIRIYKAFPDDENPTGYLPIDGALVRTGDTIYLEVNAPDGYGVAQIKENGVPFGPVFVEGGQFCRVIVSDCTNTYTVVLGRIPSLEISVTLDDTSVYTPVFG